MGNPLEELQQKYGFTPGGAPAPGGVRPQPPTPVQSRVVGNTPAPTPPAPGGTGWADIGGGKGYHRDEYGVYINNKTGLPLTKAQLQAMGLMPGGSGGGNTNVYVSPPAVAPPETPVDQVVGRDAKGKATLFFNTHTKQYYHIDPKTGAKHFLKPGDVEAASGFTVPQVPTPLDAEQQEAETVRKGQQERAKAITERDRKVLEKHDEMIAPFMQRRVLLQDALQMLDEGLSTGPIQDLTANFRSAAKELFGVEFGGNVDDQTVFRSISNRLATQMRDVGSGAMSDKDLAVFKMSVPSLAFNPEANKRMIKSMLWGMQHMEKVQQAKYEYWQRTGSLKGWDKEMKAQGLDQLYQRVEYDRKIKDEKDRRIDAVRRVGALPMGTLYVNPDGKLRERGAKDEFWTDDTKPGDQQPVPQ